MVAARGGPGGEPGRPRALIYGAGALGGTLSGVLGGIGVTLPLRVALASFLAFYLFALGPLHPRRLEEVEAMGM